MDIQNITVTDFSSWVKSLKYFGYKNPIGRGTFSAAIYCLSQNNNPFVLKEFAPNPLILSTFLTSKPKQRKEYLEHLKSRFLDECKRHLTIRHRNIVNARRIVQTGSVVGVELDYVDTSLENFLFQKGKYNILPEIDCVDIVDQIGSALTYLHKDYPENSIIHMDLKPDNLLIDILGNVKVADLGVSLHLFRYSNSMNVKFPSHTPLYAAPEIIQNDHASTSSDIWSVGTILYQMLTGKLPRIGTQTFAQLWNTDSSLVENTINSSQISDYFVEFLHKMICAPKNRIRDGEKLRDYIKEKGFEKSKLGNLWNLLNSARDSESNAVNCLSRSFREKPPNQVLFLKKSLNYFLTSKKIKSITDAKHHESTYLDYQIAKICFTLVDQFSKYLKTSETASLLKMSSSAIMSSMNSNSKNANMLYLASRILSKSKMFESSFNCLRQSAHIAPNPSCLKQIREYVDVCEDIISKGQGTNFHKDLKHNAIAIREEIQDILGTIHVGKLIKSVDDEGGRKRYTFEIVATDGLNNPIRIKNEIVFVSAIDLRTGLPILNEEIITPASDVINLDIFHTEKNRFELLCKKPLILNKDFSVVVTIIPEINFPYKIISKNENDNQKTYEIAFVPFVQNRWSPEYQGDVSIQIDPFHEREKEIIYPKQVEITKESNGVGNFKLIIPKDLDESKLSIKIKQQ